MLLVYTDNPSFYKGMSSQEIKDEFEHSPKLLAKHIDEKGTVYVAAGDFLAFIAASENNDPNGTWDYKGVSVQEDTLVYRYAGVEDIFPWNDDHKGYAISDWNWIEYPDN